MDDWYVYLIAVALVGFFGWLIISPILSERKFNQRLQKESKYAIKITCQNCFDDKVFLIPKGVCLDEFLVDRKCNTCTCPYRKTLQQEDKANE